MKKALVLIFGILIVTSNTFATKGDGKKASFKIDTKESKVYWTGKKVSGEHTGYLSIGDGNVFVEDNKVVGADFNMDLNTIECTDLSGEWKDKLVGHLKSEDFFSVEKHPKANFKITSINNSEAEKSVVGELTIKGITHEVSFPAQISIDGETLTADGTVSIDRTKWDIKYGSGKFFEGLGDKMIKDEFEIKFSLVALSSDVSLTKN